MTPRRNKYNAKKTVVDGITFASKAEARRYGELMLLQRAGKIIGLEVHPTFYLTAGIKYIADFHYVEKKSGKGVAEDVKGVQTAAFRIKAKLFRDQYPDCELRVVK